jgi:hypothetical protein
MPLDECRRETTRFRREDSMTFPSHSRLLAPVICDLLIRAADFTNAVLAPLQPTNPNQHIPLQTFRARIRVRSLPAALFLFSSRFALGPMMSAAEDRSGVVRGVVSNAATGNNLTQASVRSDGSNQEVLTDRDGSIEISHRSLAVESFWPLSGSV